MDAIHADKDAEVYPFVANLTEIMSRLRALDEGANQKQHFNIAAIRDEVESIGHSLDWKAPDGFYDLAPMDESTFRRLADAMRRYNEEPNAENQRAIQDAWNARYAGA